MTDVAATAAGAPRPEGAHAVESAIRQSFIWNLLNFVVSQGAGIVIFLALSRAVSPAMFGVFALAAIFVDLIGNQGRWAGMDAIIQRRDYSNAALSTAFYAMLAVGGAAMLVSLLGAGETARALAEPDLAFVLPALSATLLLTPPAVVMDALIMRQLKFRAQAVRSMAGTLVGGAVGITVAFGPAVEWALVAQRLASMAVTLIVLFAYTRWIPSLSFDWENARQFLRRAGQLWAATVMATLHARIIEGFVGIRAGAVELGFISVARRFEIAVNGIVTGPIQTLWVPVLSALRKDSAESWRLFLRLSQLTSLIALPAFVGLGLVAQELVIVAFDERYVDAGPVLFIIAMQGIFMPVGFFANLVFAGLDRSDLSMKFSLAYLIIITPVVWVAAGYGAFWALFWALALMAGGGVVATVMQVRMLHGRLREFAAALAPGYIACVFMTLCVLALKAVLPQNAPILSLVSMTLLGMVTFAGWLFLVHRKQVRAAWEFISAVRSNRADGPSAAEAGAASGA